MRRWSPRRSTAARRAGLGSRSSCSPRSCCWRRRTWARRSSARTVRTRHQPDAALTVTPTPLRRPLRAISDTLRQPVRDASPSVDVPPVDPPDGGSYLEVTVLDSGDLDVDQWVRSSTPLTALRLSVPADPLVDDRVVASNLRASADGTEADVPTSLGSAPAVITLADVHRVHLTYRLAGAVLRSPSRADRALARTVALDLDLNGEPRREPATISFRRATALTRDL